MSDQELWPPQNKVRDDAVRHAFKARELDDEAEAFVAAIPSLIDKVNEAAAGDAEFREDWYAVRRSPNALRTLKRAQKHIETATQAVATAGGLLPSRMISFDRITEHLAAVTEELVTWVGYVEDVQTVSIERGHPTDAGRRAAASAVAEYFYVHGLKLSWSKEGLLAEVLTHILGQEMISEDMLLYAINLVRAHYELFNHDHLGIPLPLVRPRPGGLSLKP